ncbi:MAG: alpha/beta hydrolase [Hyphomonadaceae bacterium]|nr:alpha/beta hydrolase [Hyphomonadaceae bacterium]
MSDLNSRKSEFRTPRLIATALEPRSIGELGAHYASQRWLKKLPKGDGHSVIVFPGFLTSGLSTRPLRRLLRELNYDVHDWGFGRNIRFNPQFESEMQEMVREKSAATGEKVSLVGWSLGGVFAREIAREMPDRVRNVVTLGSPITGTDHVALLRPVFEYLNGPLNQEIKDRIETMGAPMPVPTTSVYSKSDGIVHWHGAVQTETSTSENIRVPASHMGMGVHPLVMYVIANRLAQADGAWAPFEAAGVFKYLLRQ